MNRVRFLGLKVHANLWHQIIESSKAWRDAWTDILLTQQRLIQSFEVMYSPIIGAGETYEGHEPLETPEHIMQRTRKLQEGYAELKTDLLEEVNLVDTRLLKPAMDARDYIQPLRKVIKKRGDRKVPCSMK